VPADCAQAGRVGIVAVRGFPSAAAPPLGGIPQARRRCCALFTCRLGHGGRSRLASGSDVLRCASADFYERDRGARTSCGETRAIPSIAVLLSLRAESDGRINACGASRRQVTGKQRNRGRQAGNAGAYLRLSHLPSRAKPSLILA
jgi:hypothetical protein